MEKFDADKTYFANVAPEHAQAIGALDVQWRNLERSIEFLIWDYIGCSQDISECITAHINASAKADMLGSLAELRETNAGLSERVCHGLKCFDVIRENRNIFAHSNPGGVIAGEHYLFRRTARNPKGLSRVTYKIKVEHLLLMAREIEVVHRFLLVLHGFLRLSEKVAMSLPPMPTLPQRLGDLVFVEKVRRKAK